MSYTALQALWPSLPGATAAEKLAAVNAMTAPGPTIDVRAQSVSAYLAINLKLAALFDYADAPPAGAVASTVLAAKNLAALLRLPSPPIIAMSQPAIYTAMQAQLTTLASDPLSKITSDDAEALLGLAATTVSWSQANGLQTPLTVDDLSAAGLV